MSRVKARKTKIGVVASRVCFYIHSNNVDSVDPHDLTVVASRTIQSG
jgi:hypothetical protein